MDNIRSQLKGTSKKLSSIILESDGLHKVKFLELKFSTMSGILLDLLKKFDLFKLLCLGIIA